MSNNKMRFPFSQVIVVGGTGQTGHRVLEVLIEMGVGQVVATSRAVNSGLPAGGLAPTILNDAQKWASVVSWEPLDLESEQEILLNQLERIGTHLKRNVPTVLICAAAFTDVEACETNPARCERFNETNTVEVLKWASEKFNAKLVFYSTDYVFDGLAGPYVESAQRHAVSRYGQSKVFVEEWIEANSPQSLILRTTGVYDYLPGSKNFLMQMLQLWAQEKTTRIPLDQYANPVWAYELAKATLGLLERGSSGIYNVAGGSYLARTEFAQTIARIFGFDLRLIIPIRTEEMGQKAKRPLKAGVNCDKLRKELGWAPGAAEDILNQLKRHKN